MTTKNESRCAFCSTTAKPETHFFQGYLSTLICSDCVRGILFLLLNNTINTMTFTDPLEGKKNDN